jgi:hypothetical protein
VAFRQGNSKLGKKIWTFSIPAGGSCPGKTDACSKECYAADGFFLMPNVVRSLNKNWDETRQPDFVDNAINHLKKVKAKVCRVHVAGDLYDKEYAEKWLTIFKNVPDCRFFIYTRSWRIADIRPVITKMSRCKNVKMWWSVDKDTGKPKRLPQRTRLAYMQVDSTDIPAYRVDLFFRVDRAMNQVSVKKINNTLVCPVENGFTKDMNCMKCGFCWRDKGEVIDWVRSTSKIELNVIAA